MVLAIIIAAIIAAWLGCGVVAYGLTIAYFAGEFVTLYEPGHYKYEPLSEEYIAGKWRNLRRLALFTASIGPIGAGIAFLMSSCGKYGLRFQRSPSDRKAT